MMYHRKELLKQLCAIFGPSGCESRVREAIKGRAERVVDSVKVDRVGDLISKMSFGEGDDRVKIMVSAHMDEVGFMIKYIDENGMLYVVPIGGIDLMLLPGTRLAVHHGDNSFLGIVGRKPIHLLNEKERASFSIEDTWLDLGFSSREHALQCVSIGDPVTFSTECVQMSDDYFATRSADNKIGAFNAVNRSRLIISNQIRYSNRLNLRSAAYLKIHC